MRKLAITVMSLTMVVSFAAAAAAQAGPRGTSTITVKGKTISVEYGRPSLRGRSTDELLGKLPAEGFWRLGSNKVTSLKTGIDLALGNVAVPAGEYSLWMQKQADNSWKLVFNKQVGQWGTEHDASQDFASAAVKQSTNPKPVEMLTLTLHKAGNGGNLTIEWGTLAVEAGFTAK